MFNLIVIQCSESETSHLKWPSLALWANEALKFPTRDCKILHSFAELTGNYAELQ